MEIDNILQVLRSNGSIIINKNLARNIGINETILYSELASKYLYFKNKDQLTEDGYFFNTIDNMEFDSCLSEGQQRRALIKLINIGLIKLKYTGIPKKRYFKIVDDMTLLNQLLSQNNSYIDVKTTDKEITKLSALYNNTKSNNNKNNTKKINIGVSKETPLNNENKDSSGKSSSKKKETKKESNSIPETKQEEQEIVNDISSSKEKEKKKRKVRSPEITNKQTRKKRNSYEPDKAYHELLQAEYKDILDLFTSYNIKLPRMSKSKSTEQLYKILKQIETGQFSQNEFTPEWYKNIKLDKATAFDKLNKPMSVRKMKSLVHRSLRQFAKLLNDKDNLYYPADKKYAEKATALTFFYNRIYPSNYTSSYFLQYLNKEPKTAYGKITDKQYEAVCENLKDSYGITYEWVYDNVLNRTHTLYSKDDIKTIMFTTNELVKWHADSLEYFKFLNSGRESVHRFLKDIGEWYLTQSEYPPKYMTYGSPRWHWFNNWSRSTWGVDFSVDKEYMCKKKIELAEYEAQSKARDEADRRWQDKIENWVSARIKELDKLEIGFDDNGIRILAERILRGETEDPGLVNSVIYQVGWNC